MEKEISWSAPEYHHYEKDASWHGVMIAGAVIIGGIALFQKNFLFALFIVIASFLVVAWGNRKPRMLDFNLSNRGLAIDGREHSFDQMNGFAIVPAREDAALHELLFHTKGRLDNWMKVIVATEHRDVIKELLRTHLPELEYEESFSEHIGRFLRF